MSDDGIVAETTRRIFADLADPQDAGTAEPGAWKPRLWPALAEAGLPVAWAPEALGGAGAALSDGFEILRIAGQYAAPAPLAETLIAARLLTEAGLHAPHEAVTTGPLRNGDSLAMDPQGRVSGRLRAVPFAGAVSQLAGLATDADGNPHAVLLNLSDARLKPRDADLGAERADVAFDAAVPAASALRPPGAETFEALGAAARVQQMAGALETCLHLSTAYARERVAFGRPIAKFQAVQQALARLGGEVAAALTAAASAADAFAEHAHGGDVTEGDLFLEIAAAKIRAGEAAGEGAAIAHQAHGAIGFTLDYQLQRFTRQLWGWRDDFGAESHWALRLGQRACAEGADALWPALTRR